jgi:CRISPR/Cas system-associated protein Csm6
MTTAANNKSTAVEVLASEARKDIVVVREYEFVSVDRAVRWAKEPGTVITVARCKSGANAMWVRFVDFMAKPKPQPIVETAPVVAEPTMVEKIRQFITKAQATSVAVKVLLAEAKVELDREKVGAVNRYVLVGAKEDIEAALTA